MTTIDKVKIVVGQIWLEDDKRFKRYVRIIRLLHPNGVNIRTCDENGNFLPRSRETQADRGRFGRAGGYKLVSG